MNGHHWIIFSGLAGLIVLAGVVDSPFLWTLCLLAVLLYVQMKAATISDLVEKKDAAMGNRVINGMKALTELCKNAFNYIKTNHEQINRTNKRVNELDIQIKHFERQKSKLLKTRTSTIKVDNTNVIKKETIKEKEIIKDEQ